MAVADLNRVLKVLIEKLFFQLSPIPNRHLTYNHYVGDVTLTAAVVLSCSPSDLIVITERANDK